MVRDAARGPERVVTVMRHISALAVLLLLVVWGVLGGCSSTPPEPRSQVPAATVAAPRGYTVMPMQAVFLGDMDGDGLPGVNDAIAILRIVVGLDADNPIADVNRNGAADIGDAIMVLRCVVGFDDCAWPYILGDELTALIACAEGHSVAPQTELHLDGSGSIAPDGSISRYEWRVDQPELSQSVIEPDNAQAQVTFEVNVAGDYTFSLDVWDDQDQKCAQSATYVVHVVPDRALHIELLWHTPADADETDAGPFAGSDMDLHFMHPNAPSDPNAPDVDGDGSPDPYFSQPYDCFWFNPHPDWGVTGDPGLDRDDTDGAGPENVNVTAPQNGLSYLIAVHYWNAHAYGPAQATVRVYVDGALAYETAATNLVEHDLWKVGTVAWPSGTVTPCQAQGGGPCITPAYQHPDFLN